MTGPLSMTIYPALFENGHIRGVVPDLQFQRYGRAL
jgi:hypothetical protein